MDFLRRRFVLFSTLKPVLLFLVIKHDVLDLYNQIYNQRTAYFSFRFDRHFSSEEVLQLLDRFYNLEMLVCYH